MSDSPEISPAAPAPAKKQVKQTQEVEDEVSFLADNLDKRLTIPGLAAPLLICDAGYGLPREARPRKEKTLAIARQLVNFLEWQQKHLQDHLMLAKVQVVACPDGSTKAALEQRTLDLLLVNTLPSHVSFSCTSLEEACSVAFADGSIEAIAPGSNDETPSLRPHVIDEVVYLSPDAEESLDPSVAPPRTVVVGLLIDRRVQPNRSKDRASKFQVVAKRWPLEECFGEIAANEPLNVDCVLEGMQQWWWNDDGHEPDNTTKDQQRATFVEAAVQAIHHHADRHPARPVRLSYKKS